MTSARPDPASFRDPDSRVLLLEERVFRVFSPRGADAFEAFERSDLPGRFAGRGQIVHSSRVPPGEQAGLKDALPEVALALEHPRVPFLSWCYEWPFEMLQAAALLQLDLAIECLNQGYLLKDATPYNVQFVGTRPVHIDIGSFEPWPEGRPWKAYAQFCRLFLNPLLLTSLTGIDSRPWLRGSLEGIAPAELSGLLPWYRKMALSVYAHVVLQARFNRRGQSAEAAEKARVAVMKKSQLQAFLQSLRGTVSGLKPKRPATEWTDYESETARTAEGEAQKAKDAFVLKALKAVSPRVVWDLGSNTGRYSLMAADHAAQVVAMDQDVHVAGLLYRRMIREKRSNVVCLAMNLLDPSPALGWNQRERPGLMDRGRPDFCLCLALVHHLAISGNLPLPRFFDWLDATTDAGIIEFVPKQDPRVRQLLQWREDVFPDYRQERFEELLTRRFTVRDRTVLPGTDRVLYAFTR